MPIPRLPALAVATPIASSTATDHTQTSHPPSPTAPPYSPITPVMSSTTISGTPNDYQSVPPQDTPKPPPLIPFSESDNSDAIALRSAISILQIQRQQNLWDLKMLEQQKQAAVADPEAFAADVAAGRVKTVLGNGPLVGPNVGREYKASTDGLQDSVLNSDGDNERSSQTVSRFGSVPGPQNIIRSPPINWAKYHIVGESLDKLHEEQRARPKPGQPRRDDDPLRAPKNVIAAPYSPWTDKPMDSPMRTRSSSKKEE
ncbi:hypothetical protein MMC07_003417 [Pseudocyphellaria aurata]|nr:hypothetical protein [Pseudocyphellaria aurata]